MNKKEFAAIDTTKATKNELLEALTGIPASANIKKDENFMSRLNYTLAQAKKSIKKVTVSDLSALVTEAQGILMPAPAAAASKKPASMKKTTKAEPEEDEDSDSETDAEETKPEKKTTGKKTLKAVKTVPQKTKASKLLPTASMFPDEITFDADDGKKTLKCAHGKYHTIEQIRKALEEDSTLYIAAYWTKRHIKEYDYNTTFGVTAPKSFPDDLDILNIVVACDTIDRVFAMSTYTEAMYRFEGADFDPVDDEDPATGDKYTVRVSNGMEFEVYEEA